ncbi:DUF1266 domain-containing protein [Tenacibaculum finnmarkense]|uniref:DUF1266 domain-containing protein n=1 Tax=Tenacibaculum finnmarkense TaxID=2781243 RepID=UPI001E424E38|nr:DUF1266 domain-containing protein [Tenacibaculum finnmarkense]MCD8446346.1 DUF1266 domain-containing protein [Tenacibaculum finnmarkense genomovar finnmarkense]
MNQNTYYIIGAIAVVFTIYIIFVITYASKRKKKQLEKFNNLKPLNKSEKNALVFGAILSYHRGEDILEIKPKDSIDTYKNGLRDSWEISNKEEAIETISALISLERSQEFDKYLLNPSEDLTKIEKKIAKGLKLELGEIQQVKSTFSWDICRAVSLAKWCFWCDYLTEEECWKFINQAVNTAQNLGSNWKDYTISFLLGRTMQGFDLDDVIIESEQLLSGKNLLGEKEFLTVYSKFPYK